MVYSLGDNSRVMVREEITEKIEGLVLPRGEIRYKGITGNRNNTAFLYS